MSAMPTVCLNTKKTLILLLALNDIQYSSVKNQTRRYQEQEKKV